MFRSSRKYFRLIYYISSLGFSFLLLIIYVITSELHDVNYNFSNLIVNNFTEKKAVFIILVILFIISMLALHSVKSIIISTKKLSKSSGTRKVRVSEQYNQGFRDFIMSILVPIVSTFSITDQPSASLVLLLLIQFITYKFYVNSSDIFPNIALAMWGYSIFIGRENKDSKMWYIFGETQNINKIILSNQVVTALGDPGYKNNNIAIIVEEN